MSDAKALQRIEALLQYHRAVDPNLDRPRAVNLADLEAALTTARAQVREECARIALRVGNFGDFQRHELTEDCGQPRFDMMTAIVEAIRSSGVAETPKETEEDPFFKVPSRVLTADERRAFGDALVRSTKVVGTVTATAAPDTPSQGS